jgi:hypothetical protein
MSERMKPGMDESDRKQSHYNTYNQKRNRLQLKYLQDIESFEF